VNVEWWHFLLVKIGGLEHRSMGAWEVFFEISDFGESTVFAPALRRGGA
jgi:hypothetical protein